MKTKREFLFNPRPLSEKSKKNLEIFEVMRKKGIISRLDISKITGINTVSVSNYMKNYISQNLVLERGFDVSTGGRKPELVELNLKGNYAIGVDVNDSGMRIALTDLAINAIEKNSVGISGKADTPGIIAAVEDVIKRSRVEPDKIKAVGIGISNPDAVSVEDIRKKSGIEVFTSAREICAASAENRLNPASQGDDLLYMHSDLGYGVIIKNETYIDSESEYGKSDSPEYTEYLSGWGRALGMVESAKGEIEKGVGTRIVDLVKGNIANITQKTVIAAAKDKDEIATDIVEHVGMNLGLKTAYLINLFGPKVVVIGGGVEEAGELILAPVKRVVRKLSLNKYSNVVIALGAIGEDAVSLGAASLAIREILLKA